MKKAIYIVIRVFSSSADRESVPRASVCAASTVFDNEAEAQKFASTLRAIDTTVAVHVQQKVIEPDNLDDYEAEFDVEVSARVEYVKSHTLHIKASDEDEAERIAHEMFENGELEDELTDIDPYDEPDNVDFDVDGVYEA